MAFVMASREAKRQTTYVKCDPDSWVNEFTVQDLRPGDAVDIYSRSSGDGWVVGYILKSEPDLVTVEYDIGGKSYQKDLRTNSPNIRKTMATQLKSRNAASSDINGCSAFPGCAGESEVREVKKTLLL